MSEGLLATLLLYRIESVIASTSTRPRIVQMIYKNRGVTKNKSTSIKACRESLEGEITKWQVAYLHTVDRDCRLVSDQTGKPAFSSC
jgi:hypothetical protein